MTTQETLRTRFHSSLRQNHKGQSVLLDDPGDGLHLEVPEPQEEGAGPAVALHAEDEESRLRGEKSLVTWSHLGQARHVTSLGPRAPRAVP